MDLRPRGSAVVFCLLVIVNLGKFSQAQSGTDLCSLENAPIGNIIFVAENNTIGDIVATIIAENDVKVIISHQQPEGLFSLAGLSIKANIVLDYETFDKDNPYSVDIECTKDDSNTKLTLTIIVENINDNPPVFAESQYTFDINELTKVDTSVARITATDADGDRLLYRLESPEGEFELRATFEPDILVKKLLDYDKVKKVTMTLYAQDNQDTHTTSTIIVVNIIDIDNRPPWFQPCTEMEVGTSKVCLNSGYEGTVNLTEQATGPLPLKPGPVNAIDGDKGRNEAIGYTFLGGNDDGTFDINTDTGSITMLKPVGVAGPIVLSVMAFQVQNIDQFATTTVILRVVEISKHPPKFVKPSYEGFISEDADVDSLVLESQISNKPLRVQATDEDFSNGVNPNIRFEVVDGTDFLITPEGFILMAKAVAPGTINLQMRVVDTTNDESSTAFLTVEVTPGVPTTTMVTTITTTSIITTKKTTDTPLTESTSIPTSSSTSIPTSISTSIPTSIPTSISTSIPTSIPTSVSTSIPSSISTSISTPHLDTSTSNSVTSTTPGPTTGGPQMRSGGYRPEDMAALGASLAVVIILCLVSIGLLVHHIKGHNADWKKLSEASIFRSTLGGGPGGPKMGMQYTNKSFQHDDDSGSMNSSLAADLEMKLESGLKSEPSWASPQEQVTPSSASILQTPTTRSIPPDSTSLGSLDTLDGEKEVKPILTKERRAEEGYKAVWFKEDIDPNTKEEVVIIPDTSEPEGDNEEEDDSEEEQVDEEHLKTDVDEELAGRYSRGFEDEGRMTSDL
ncbi:cadherin-related family member 5-like [Myxocyprinus asiaticus]|uniref:cadherin-related family member 5-like n=1 Tax=Myxocyprinus asiaticus TaxID=70543 RepID=UPI002223D54A|nr:cadherin-related family member 5-like [Myxocyprinus asiaticus]